MISDKFRLQSVLDLQMIKRDRLRGELAEALDALQSLSQRQAELVAQQAALQVQVRASQSGTHLDVQQVAELRRYEQVLRERLQEIAAEQLCWEDETQRRRELWEQAERELKVWQQVAQRDRQRYRQQQQKVEEHQLDESCLTNMAIHRRSSS